MSPKDKQNMYKLVFGNEAGRTVLTDLNIFCFGTSTTMGAAIDEMGRIDALELARREGRREVFLQVINMLKCDIGQVYDEYVEGDIYD